ncbi:DUF2976 domain-containing protein [uncultured Shewanella sp.]|uniref:DUF2976 domain-containing protein n=1 Tax=uncultured Shewanella sp. TaxID=173975 RepID=UPI00260720E3|nr:DUF2976 domain-containing protein [uncultured Shewanella sp.]
MKKCIKNIFFGIIAIIMSPVFAIPEVNTSNTTDYTNKATEWIQAGVQLMAFCLMSYFFVITVSNLVSTYNDTGPGGKSSMIDVAKQAIVAAVLGTAAIFLLNALLEF